MIVGLGIDVCAVERFESPRPGVLERLFTPPERVGSAETLAGRFAAKEALAKALGAPGGLAWTDCIVGRKDSVADDHSLDPSGPPFIELTGTVRARADALGVTDVFVSITHDGGVAVAVVVCERR